MHDDASLETKGRFVLHSEQQQSDGLGDMSISCPKCASRNGSMLESVYENGSSKRSAPPDAMEVKGWFFLALGSALALVALHPGMSWRGAAFALVATGAATMGSLATLYNLHRLPILRNRWKKSVMCSRCGHVFMYPDVTLAKREGV